MTREQMKSHFVVHTNGQDEWIKVDKRIYDKAIDMFCAAHEAELKAKDEQIVELNAEIEKANQIIQAKHKWVMDEKEQTEFYFDKYQEIKAKIKTKDERIEAQSSVIIACQNAILQKDERIAELETERDKYNTIAANLQISRQKAYDTIAELETIIEKMKSCENCESHTNVGSKCLLDMEDSLECRANNYLNWKLKDNE